MNVQLIVTNNNNKGQIIPINVPAFRIGRAEDCQLRSNSSRISPQHCVISTHNCTVTVHELGSETGTFVNGKRIVSSQELKDGDELVAGRHSFVLSIRLSAEPEEQPSTESEITFEVRHKGQSIVVTKGQLFDMAREGAVLPDDIITVGGTKVFADSVHGIIFGNGASTVTPPPIPKPPKPDPYDAMLATLSSDPLAFQQLEELEKNANRKPRTPAASVKIDPCVKEAAPSNIAAESREVIQRLPEVKKRRTFSDLVKPLEEPLKQASTWMSGKITQHQAKAGGFVLAGVCLLGLLLYLFLSDSKSVEGAVRIEGTVTLDGAPLSGANVILHPRNRKVGQEAGGMTDHRGRFTVTTGNDPIGRGAVPGEYDVTFIMHSYERPTTSGSPIVVNATGRNRFVFELFSESSGIFTDNPFANDPFTDNPFAEDFGDNPFAK